ncbi:MAG: hypothetical protein K2G60_00225 [Oscillospiraceae bacterium]|nr:hypothetical protein [Oscillospiraceae bacterium]
MNEEQYKNVIAALVEFVVRVSKGETTSEKEVEVLPEVISGLIDISQSM